MQNQFLFNSIKGGISLLLPVLHGGSGIKTGEAHIFFKKKNVVVGSFTADGNLLQPTGCVNSTPLTSLFLLHSVHI